MKNNSKFFIFSLSMILSGTLLGSSTFANETVPQDSANESITHNTSEESPLKLDTKLNFNNISSLKNTISIEDFSNFNEDSFDNDYQKIVDYNAYKTKLYVKTHLNEDMENGPSENAISFLVDNLDDFKSYMSHLNDDDFADLIYSITTTYNNLDENKYNPWKEKLLKKSDTYNQFFNNQTFNNQTIVTRRALPEYDPSRAVNYAKVPHKNPSKNYFNYDGKGGDCANFVSQCLISGRMAMRKYNNDIWNNSNWYYYGNGQDRDWSGSWIQASNFKHHWAARAGISVHDVPKNATNIYFKTAYGTPISLINKSTGQARHTIIVGGRKGSNDWWYYDRSGSDRGNSLLQRVQNEKIVQECLTF